MSTMQMKQIHRNNDQYRKKHPAFEPVGLSLQSVEVTSDQSTVRLVFADRVVTLGCEGDCCAHAFFSDLEVAADLPANILEWNDDRTAHEDNLHCDVRDTQFIKIKTDKGYVDLSLHTEHNGYYGGWYFLQSMEMDNEQ